MTTMANHVTGSRKMTAVDLTRHLRDVMNKDSPCPPPGPLDRRHLHLSPPWEIGEGGTSGSTIFTFFRFHKQLVLQKLLNQLPMLHMFLHLPGEHQDIIQVNIN